MYIDLRMKLKKAINDTMIHEKTLKRKSLYRGGAISQCSQCSLPMSKKTADMQIENKREFAPICVACCLDKPRKDRGRVQEHYDYVYKAKMAIEDGVPFPKEKRDGHDARVKELNKLSDR